MTNPDTDRRVLTWIRDIDGIQGWAVDSCLKNGIWVGASAWGCEILYWEELPPKPKLEGVE